jgi:hypothetical protein
MPSLAMMPFRSERKFLRERLGEQLERNKDLEVVLAQTKRTKARKALIEKEKEKERALARPRSLAEWQYLREVADMNITKTDYSVSIVKILGQGYRANAHVFRGPALDLLQSEVKHFRAL